MVTRASSPSSSNAAASPAWARSSECTNASMFDRRLTCGMASGFDAPAAGLPAEAAAASAAPRYVDAAECPAAAAAGAADDPRGAEAAPWYLGSVGAAAAAAE